MRLSVVFELLLVFLFLAFAAARVIDPASTAKNVAKGNKKATTLRQGPPNRYCACTSRMCNCCRDFSLPVVPIKGPGCASIMYVQRDTMMVTMSFGDRVLSNTTIAGKNPKPICMALPGGISQFCGRVYGISRKGDQFRACLGLELRALDDIEAALRVSCFKFGPKGVKLESAPPVPAETGGTKDPDDDDDEDYDLDDDDDLIGFVDDEDDGASSEDNEVDSDSVDYTGFSVLGEDILGTLFSDDSSSSSAKRKKPNKKTARPQVVAPKVSTTTRRPGLPVRRRSTVRPEKVTNRPILNRITKKPGASTAKPAVIIRPSSVVSQSTVYSTAIPVVATTVTKTGQEKIATKAPTTTAAATPAPQTLPTTVQYLEEKLSSAATAAATEQPVTFTLPTQRVEVVKNEIKIPQIDLAKVEAVAAIAQQDVSGVISSTSITAEETERPPEVVTVKYVPEATTSYVPPNTEKVNSVKFVPTTVVTSRPSAELMTEDDLLDGAVHAEIVTQSGVKKRVTTQAPASEEDSDEDDSDEDGGEDEDDEEEEVEDEEKKGEAVGSNKIDKNAAHKKGNFTVKLKKQPTKVKQDKPEEETDDEEEEDDDDLLEGVLGDNEEAEGEEEEDEESQPLGDRNEEEDDEEEEESVQIQKPSKVSVKKKPPKESEEEEEEEEEEDILDVLSDDDDDDDDDDEESEDEEEQAVPQKNKKKKKGTTRKPATQKPVTPKPATHSRRPATTTEKVLAYNATDKFIIYKQPAEPATQTVPQKVVIYQEPDNKLPNKVFVYREPVTKVQDTTQKVIFYTEPVESVTQKFVIYKEPLERVTLVPAAAEETEKPENDDDDDDDDSEEESYEEGEKHTLVASIVRPGFSNKYAEEHDLADGEDLDIEDADEDGNDFEEDRKLKGVKKAPASPEPTPKILTLGDLIGQRKKPHHDGRPISTSRTHRRMNLDRLLQGDHLPAYAP